MHQIRTLPILLVFLLQSALAEANTNSPPIDFEKPFTIDAKVEEIVSVSERHTVESGVSDGVAYQISYADGSAIFAGTKSNAQKKLEKSEDNWTIACTKDPINDQKSCHMHTKDLWVFSYPHGGYLVSIGAGHFPGSKVAIRLDGGKPFTSSATGDGHFSQLTSARLAKRLRSTKTVTTRYMKWPNKAWEDQTWDLYGFDQANRYISWAVTRMK
jgi:hypothetical protein